MSKEYEIFQGYGIPIELPDAESFLKCKETLTRIGIPSYKNDEKTFINHVIFCIKEIYTSSSIFLNCSGLMVVLLSSQRKIKLGVMLLL